MKVPSGMQEEEVGWGQPFFFVPGFNGDQAVSRGGYEIPRVGHRIFDQITLHCDNNEWRCKRTYFETMILKCDTV